MPELIGGYETVDGDRYLKKRASDGDIYHVRKGEGIVSEDAYHGGKSRFEFAVTSDDGNVLPDIRDAMSMSELRDRTGIPFDREGSAAFVPEDASQTVKNRLEEKARFEGFFDRRVAVGDYQRTESDRLEAAKEYLEFRAEIAEADSESVRAQIRQRYMKAGY